MSRAGAAGVRRRLSGQGQGLRDLWGMQTLAGRLALAGIAWIAVWALALLLAFYVLLAHVLAGEVDAALKARAEAVSATVRVRDGQLRVVGGDNDIALDAGTSIYLGHQLVEGYALRADLEADLVQRGQHTADRERQGPVRYLSLPIQQGRRQVGTIVVSSDVGARSRTAKIVGGASVAFVLLLVVFTFFALQALLKRAMRPVELMGDQAAAWSDKDIDRRFNAGSGPLELRHLALTLNALLERIAATVRHERRLTAELSHEMRTPLAHLHAEVELLSPSFSGSGQSGQHRDHEAPAEPLGADDVEHLLTSIRRLEGLVETALAPARVERHGTPGLGQVAQVLAGLAAPTSSPARLVVTGRTSVTLGVESDVARRALLPVLENAWRYAVREVGIDVSVHDGQAWIAVSDDGGRLDPAQAGSIFEPGFRAEAGDGHPGAGLGLALTRRICRSAGGDAVATVAGGRTIVTLHLPCL